MFMYDYVTNRTNNSNDITVFRRLSLCLRICLNRICFWEVLGREREQFFFIDILYFLQVLLAIQKVQFFAIFYLKIQCIEFRFSVWARFGFTHQEYDIILCLFWFDIIVLHA